MEYLAKQADGRVFNRNKQKAQKEQPVKPENSDLPEADLFAMVFCDNYFNNHITFIY